MELTADNAMMNVKFTQAYILCLLSSNRSRISGGGGGGGSSSSSTSSRSNVLQINQISGPKSLMSKLPPSLYL
jgi:hypothetical protein